MAVRGAPAKGIGCDKRREGSNPSFSAISKICLNLRKFKKATVYRNFGVYRIWYASFIFKTNVQQNNTKNPLFFTQTHQKLTQNSPETHS